jgi:hypothetical protein
MILIKKGHQERRLRLLRRRIFQSSPRDYWS